MARIEADEADTTWVDLKLDAFVVAAVVDVLEVESAPSLGLGCGRLNMNVAMEIDKYKWNAYLRYCPR